MPNTSVNKSDHHYVKSIMQKKVLTATPKTSLLEVCKSMAESKISCIIIMDKEKISGIITERDITRLVTKLNRDFVTVEAWEVMTSPVMTISPDTKIVHASKLLKEHKVRRFPVSENKKLVGLVTETDLLYGMITLVRFLNWKLVNTKIAMEEHINELKENDLIEKQKFFGLKK